MKRTVLILAAAVSFAMNARAAVVQITVNDMIHPISDEFIGRALGEAQRTHAEAVLIELQTPGGLIESTRSIVEKLMTSRVPVVVYVAPAGSRAVAPGTNTGAAHPGILGGDKMDPVMKTKLENDSAALMRTIAAKRGRNVAVAESAVRESKSFTEQEALQQKLIDVIAADVPSLLRAIDGRSVRLYDGTNAVLRVAGKPVTRYEMTLKERLLSTLMDPNLALLLLALGSVAIFAEFNHPGAVLPGVVGVISILLALFALNLLPTRYAALALLLAAFALFALEAKFATHGVLGIGGVVCMIIGGLFLVDGPIPEMRVKFITAAGLGVASGAIVIFLMTIALRARRNRVVTGQEGMIGEIGIARTALGPEGKVFVHGEIWNAVAKKTIDEGARVRVAGVEGLHLLVEPAE